MQMMFDIPVVQEHADMVRHTNNQLCKLVSVEE